LQLVVKEVKEVYFKHYDPVLKKARKWVLKMLRGHQMLHREKLEESKNLKLDLSEQLQLHEI